MSVIRVLADCGVTFRIYKNVFSSVVTESSTRRMRLLSGCLIIHFVAVKNTLDSFQNPSSTFIVIRFHMPIWVR
jgi:hypothetical protein